MNTQVRYIESDRAPPKGDGGIPQVGGYIALIHALPKFLSTYIWKPIFQNLILYRHTKSKHYFEVRHTDSSVNLFEIYLLYLTNVLQKRGAKKKTHTWR